MACLSNLMGGRGLAVQQGAQPTRLGRSFNQCSLRTAPPRPLPFPIAARKRTGYQDYDDLDTLGYLPNDYTGDFTEILDGDRDAPLYTPSRRPAGMRSIADDFADDLYSTTPYEDVSEEDDFPEPDPDSAPRYVNGKQLYINKEIKAQVVRLLGGPDGKEQFGVKPFSEALSLARDLGVDVILLNGETNPPVCRLVDWSKYKFEMEKSSKQKSAKSSSTETKEVRIRPKTDSNDLNTKLKSATKFLSKGNRVKVMMKFEGRELQFKEQGKEVLLRFIDEVGDAGRVDGPLNFKGNTYSCVLVPTGKSGGKGSGKSGSKSRQSSPAAESSSSRDMPLPPPPPPVSQAQPASSSSSMPPPPPPPPPSQSVQGASLRPPPPPPVGGPARPGSTPMPPPPPPMNRPMAPPGQPARPNLSRPGGMPPPPPPPLRPPPPPRR